MLVRTEPGQVYTSSKTSVIVNTCITTWRVGHMGPQPTKVLKSKLWLLDKSKLQELTSAAKSLTELIKTLGLSVSGGTFVTLKRVLRAREVDFSHINLGRGANLGRIFKSIHPLKPLKEVMVVGSTYSRWSLR